MHLSKQNNSNTKSFILKTKSSIQNIYLIYKLQKKWYIFFQMLYLTAKNLT